MKNKVKFAFIGAGSKSFCPATVTDILNSERFKSVDNMEICLMDIQRKPLDMSHAYCLEVAKYFKRSPTVNATMNLSEAVDGADFVINAIEKDRFYYWTMDFHIPRTFGFKSVFGENGGPGGMFHYLRNVGPSVEIAKAMEKGCPGAWLLSYTNPEHKLVEAISKLTKTNAVGLCHAEMMGMDQLAKFTGVPRDDIGAIGCGINHLGFFTKIWKKSTGEDLYPLLREKEKEADPLADWDEYAMSRLMFHAFGVWPYPGANHIGEYIGFANNLLASADMQFFYDPAEVDIWKEKMTPEWIYSLSSNPADRPLFSVKKAAGGDSEAAYNERFTLNGEPRGSGEYGIPIAESIFFNEPKYIGAVNVLNNGYITNVLDRMCVEVPANVDGDGVHPVVCGALPTAAAAMVSLQGSIHQLLVEAFEEKSRRKLLQALLIDPTVSTYNNAVALINKMFEMQAEALPDMKW